MPKDKTIEKTKDAKEKGKKISVGDIYKKKEHAQHILDEPDTAVGSIEKESKDMWIYDSVKERFIRNLIEIVPAFYKIIDELLVNMIDQNVRSTNCDTIKVYVDKKTGVLTFWNNGSGIPVIMHPEHKMYIPELIFGHLLTSSQYDNKDRTTGGKNGYGAKVANIFSTRFILETVGVCNEEDIEDNTRVDMKNKKKNKKPALKFYKQEWKNNMFKRSDPEIKEVKSSEDQYTQVTLYPDFERFSLDGISDDMFDLIHKRVFDLAACARNKLTVYFNDVEIKTTTFRDFIDLHFEEKPEVIYDDVNDFWKVGIVFEPDEGARNISFVNGIWTYTGGTHVKHVQDQIADKVIEHVKKHHKGLEVKKATILEHLTIFISCILVSPSFTSQSKDTLSTGVKNFSSKCELDNLFMKKVMDTGLVDKVVKIAQFQQDSKLEKTDGKKTGSLRMIPKLRDAIYAGSKKSKDTRLILTEGDSATPFAIHGLSVIGREYYGVFPLKGKVLNVDKANTQKVSDNKEFALIKQIMGLKQNVVYEDTSKLRYGGIIILTDQDLDGSHIKGLVINMFKKYWPSLLAIDGFMQTISTPIIKAFKKNDKKKQHTKVFYSEQDFQKWVKDDLNGSLNGWEPKYYKGLGTSDAKEAKEVFHDLENRLVTYIWEVSGGTISREDIVVEEKDDKKIKQKAGSKDSTSSSKSKKSINKESDDLVALDASFDKYNQGPSYDAMTIAFGKEEAKARREWLSEYDQHDTIDYTKTEVTISDYVHKDFKHFANYAILRMIPSVCDGLKPSQRKILHGCFKKNVNKDIKVSQLANYVSEHTAYKHGEDSLNGAIIEMAQNYPTSNNIHILHPAGSFGYRDQAGEEHASPRYIFTYIEPIARKIFRDEDLCILKYLEDEGQIVEPEWFAPIIPMILVNGAIGIGVGYSTKIPPLNPIEIANNIIRMLDDKDPKPMHPYWRRFLGTVKDASKGNKHEYKIYGKVEVLDDETVRITEIPANGPSIQKYNAFLNKLLIMDKKKDTKKIVTSIFENCGVNDIDFTIKFKGGTLHAMLKEDDDAIYKFLKLVGKYSCDNMHLYNSKGVMTKYDTVEDILKDFYTFRLDIYAKRREFIIKKLKVELEKLKYKLKFIDDYTKKVIKVHGQSKDDVIAKLEQLKYPKFPNKEKQRTQSGIDLEENEDETKMTYRYITDMGIFSLTKEKVKELEDEFNSKKKDLDYYVNITDKELWKKEINEFLVEYEKWLLVADAGDDEENTKKAKKGKGKAFGKGKGAKNEKPKKKK